MPDDVIGQGTNTVYYPHIPLVFGLANIAGTTTGSLLTLGGATGHILYFSAWIMAITIDASEAKAAGTLTVTPTKNGSACTDLLEFLAIPLATSSKSRHATRVSPLLSSDRLLPVDEVGIDYATVGLTPTTLGLTVTLWLGVERI